MRTRLRIAIAIAGLLVGGVSSASASIISEVGPSFVQPNENLLLQGVVASGRAVEGITDQTGTFFNLIGMEPLVIRLGGITTNESPDTISQPSSALLLGAAFTVMGRFAMGRFARRRR